MTNDPFCRATLLLGAIAVASPAFALSTSSNNNFVMVSDGGLATFVVLGLLALASGFTGRLMWAVVAGAGFAVATLVQLIQLGRSTNWLDGSGSTMSLMAALALGLVLTGWIGRSEVR